MIDKGRLIAALEFKSHVGPSFGNNFNNRAEEAIGTSHDLWTAYREGAFGKQERPFVGWLMVVEDAPDSRAAVRESSPHFPVFPEFAGGVLSSAVRHSLPAAGKGTALLVGCGHRYAPISRDGWRLFRVVVHDGPAVLRGVVGRAHCCGGCQIGGTRYVM